MINSIAFSLIALCIIYITSLLKKSNFRIFYITVSTCSLLLSCVPNRYGMIGIAALVFTTMLGPSLIILEDNRQ
ncbi:hypothetical protein AVL91_21945 [Salmonella enterica]|jgi:hypothetical protein|nr:hypothetical protein [Salmonella enterica]ECN5535977.1 hypothetical protein [Salmonella enterica subsp. enterica serovar Newport]EDO6516126.1 hypothetical protein [Salmonella enterica subsp. enterica serovar Agona]EDS1692005.1 hypothetical protein [Salmonella enterica subsp. enterica serovar 4,[5],12:i:-]EDS6201826.1 hypothetical protein [Salmonella enterica subsp. enterica serovar Braenderup]EDX1871161.1 hypothetical protein [Salmonella enterica subsp. enterica]EEE1186744.1 hypothetical p